MRTAAVQESVKPVELAAQQASELTIRSVNLSIEQIQGVCQEFLDKFLSETDVACVSTYEVVLAEKDRTERDLSLQQKALRKTETELESLRQKASLIGQASAEALDEFKTQAEKAAVLMVEKSVLEREEAQRRIETSLAELQARLDAVQQEVGIQIEAAEEREASLRETVGQAGAAVSVLSARLAEMKELPAVAAYLSALEEERRQERQRILAAIRFLGSAPWVAFSQNRKATPRLCQVEALSRQDATVFDALVERLSAELNRLDSTSPAIAWSVIRVIDELGLQDLFPELPRHRTRLGREARLHKQELAREKRAIPTKVVSLASHWGARLAAS